jgi:hypothetical protein
MSEVQDMQELTVGPAGADVVGADSRAVQFAVDALWARGGGTVRLLPGTYLAADAVHLRSGVSLVGSGPDTVLRRAPGFVTPMKIDADYGQLKLTPADAAGFEVGMGLAVADGDAKGGWAVTVTSIVRIADGSLYVDSPMERDYRADREGQIAAASSVVSGVDVEDVQIASITVEGNAEQNPFLNGCRGGGIYLRRARRCAIMDCVVRDFNGDGISFQITQDITVQDCESTGNTNLGIHPGTGSARSVVRNCRSYENGQVGLFICWRVQDGVFEGNDIHHTGRYGISIGHKDTGNVFLSNTIRCNGRDGVYFRKEREPNAAHNNTFKGNVIEDNGSDEHGCGIHVEGPVSGLVFADNAIRETRSGDARTQRHAILTAGDVSFQEQGNVMEGHPDAAIYRQA